MVCSTTGSPRVSLGSGIVTLPAAVGICTFVVWLSSRGVRSSIGDCPRGTSLVLSPAVVRASRSDRSLFSCLKQSISSPCFLLQSSNSLLHVSRSSSLLSKVFSHPLQFVFCYVQNFHCFIRLDFFFYSRRFSGTAALSYELDEAASLLIS